MGCGQARSAGAVQSCPTHPPTPAARNAQLDSMQPCRRSCHAAFAAAAGWEVEGPKIWADGGLNDGQLGAAPSWRRADVAAPPAPRQVHVACGGRHDARPQGHISICCLPEGGV